MYKFTEGKMKNEPKFSINTLKLAIKIGHIAKKIGMDVGLVRDNPKKYGDMVFFMLSNGPDVCIIQCTRYAYFVEYYWDAHRGGLNSDYFMIKNIRNFLFYLKKRNFVDFDTWDTKITDSLQKNGVEFEEQFEDYFGEGD